MVTRVEKDGAVWTVIRSRPEAPGAMDPESAEALYDSFRAPSTPTTAPVWPFSGVRVGPSVPGGI
jgi:hypothetical protein